MPARGLAHDRVLDDAALARVGERTDLLRAVAGALVVAGHAHRIEAAGRLIASLGDEQLVQARALARALVPTSTTRANLDALDRLDALDPSRFRGAHVYFLRCASRVKIGHSGDVAGRIARLQTGVPSTLRLDLIAVTRGGPGLERDLHVRFLHARETREWFAPTLDLLECIGREGNLA